MVTILVVCFIGGTGWKPPAGWDVVDVSNRTSSAAVTLSREVASGTSITVPDGCETHEDRVTRTLTMPGWSATPVPR